MRGGLNFAPFPLTFEVESSQLHRSSPSCLLLSIIPFHSSLGIAIEPMSTREDSEKSSKMQDLASDLDRQATLSESTSSKVTPSTSDMTTSTDTDKEDHSGDAAPGSPNSISFAESYHNTTDGDSDVSVLARRKSSLMSAGYDQIRPQSMDGAIFGTGRK